MCYYADSLHLEKKSSLINLKKQMHSICAFLKSIFLQLLLNLYLTYNTDETGDLHTGCPGSN